LEESKNTDDLIRFYETYNKQWREMIDASTEQLSGCFRRFSPDYVRARILSSLTEVLQRARRYDEAIDLIQYLLSRLIFCVIPKKNQSDLDRATYNRHRRGKLWNRLALIQENYIKTNGHQQCLNTIHQALQDSCVKLGDRLALCERARKLFSRPKSKGILEATWITDIWNVPMPKEV
jgi:hypothetical protein